LKKTSHRLKVSLFSYIVELDSTNNFYFLVDSDEKHRCMVRLMKMSLNLNDKTAEALMSPSKQQPAGDEEEFDNVKIEEVYLE
jgi:hypothetical protein